MKQNILCLINDSHKQAADLYRYLLLLGFILSFQLWCQDKPKVILLTADPQDLTYFYQSKPYNIATDTEKLLVNALDQYHIELQAVPLARIAILLRSKQSYCVSSRIKTPERAAYNWYSLPLMIYPGLRLYWLSNNKLPPSLLNSNEQLTSIVELFDTQPQAILGLSRGRSYGAHIDSQIKQLKSQNILIRGGERRFLALISMLNDNKFDYLIELPTELKRENHLFDHPQQLKSVAIAGIPEFQNGHIACSKTPANKQFIKAVDIALKKLYLTDAFYQAHTRYMNNSDLSAFKQYFRQNISPK